MKKPSSISIELLNQLPRINDVRFSGNGNRLVWSESTGTLGVIFERKFNGRTHRLSGDQNARGSIGYGGGDLGVSLNQVIFPDRSGSLYIATFNQKTSLKAITPAWGSTAAPVFSPDGKWVVYCYNADEIDGLAITRTYGLSWPSQLTLGADFYMQPAWNPSGKRIAWVEWNHPDMPWDASHIKLGELGGMQLQLFGEHWIAGDKGHAACQPQFSPDGKWMAYIIRDGDWDNLILYNLKKRTHKILVQGKGFHLRLPDWIQGMRSYGWNASSTTLYYFRYSHGETTLWKVGLQKGESRQLDISPMQWAVQLDVSPIGDDLVFLGSSPKIPKRICLFCNGRMTFSQTETEKDAGEYCTDPMEVTFPIPGSKTGYGFYYPPLNSHIGKNAKPSLILQVHGGPTSANTKTFSSDAAYFVSRGYAYAQVNYRGSSGYGYDYQDALCQQWGVADVEDTIAFANALVAQGLVYPDQMAILGSSAGGFTVLNTLIRQPGLFKVGICSYGVSDLLEDARNTHKFEKYYHQFLVGDLKKNRQRFVVRSPINNIEKIKDPVALFHGDEDKVVSLNQTLSIYQKLKDNGVSCELQVYQGEGHGFRKPETLKDYYEKIEIFLTKYL
ncbi:MAG: prolyl oligopeptidase family serine peptidase [Anaerolineaceae bacterium]|nr:prolyl oligopeptidase family serine peptidase [Anaerolineaceae bacterium]